MLFLFIHSALQLEQPDILFIFVKTTHVKDTGASNVLRALSDIFIAIIIAVTGRALRLSSYRASN